MTARLESFKVLVIGDSCTDIYHTCSNTRLNPESSAPLVQIVSTMYKKGMAKNVVNCLAALGVNTKLITSQNNSTKTRYINAKTNEHLLRVDFEDKIDPLTVEEIDNTVFPHLYDALVISDYDKGFLSYYTINYLAQIFTTGPIFLDTKKKLLDKIDPRIYLKINEHEANAANMVPERAIVTLGEKGVFCNELSIPAMKVKAVDVCGAGDAFLAGLVYGHLQDYEFAVEYGIVNAGISVQHLGTYAPTLEELNKGFYEYIKTR